MRSLVSSGCRSLHCRCTNVLFKRSEHASETSLPILVLPLAKKVRVRMFSKWLVLLMMTAANCQPRTTGNPMCMHKNKTLLLARALAENRFTSAASIISHSRNYVPNVGNRCCDPARGWNLLNLRQPDWAASSVEAGKMTPTPETHIH